MSNTFYTNIYRFGNKILHRGYENGVRVQYRNNFSPKLYVSAKKKGSQFKGIRGQELQEMQPGSIKECKDFIETYHGVENFEIHGMTDWVLQYINSLYPTHEPATYDKNLLRILSIDIEVESENGFSSTDDASEKINAITLSFKGKKWVYAIHEFVLPESTNLVQKVFASEADMLQDLLFTIRNDIDPDILTGWNCIPTNSNIWLKDKILEIKNLKKDMILQNSTVKNISPVTKKQVYEIHLSNGKIQKFSGDHIIPILSKDKSKYWNMIKSKKTNIDFVDTAVSGIDLSKDNYIEVLLHNNLNKDFNINGIIPDNIIFYILGMIYTDGSIQNKIISIYNNDIDIINYIKTYLDPFKKMIRPGTGITKSKKNNYRIRSNITDYNPLTPYMDMIYFHKKKLNIELLSKLSSKQFFAFLSGIIDGDGSVTPDGKSISIANKRNGDLEILYELLLWNGYMATIGKDGLFIGNNEVNYPIWKNITLISSKKQNRINKLKFEDFTKNTNSSSKIIKKRINGNKLYLKIDDIIKTEEYTDMMDIETDTNYFIYSGSKVHNCKFFDVPYLINRIKKVLDTEDKIISSSISPWNIIKEDEVDFRGKICNVYKIAGIAILDYLELYRKYTYNQQESYALNNIASVELGKKKLDYSEYDSIKEFYTQNFQKFVEYNVLDVDLVDELDHKLNLIDLHVSMAYLAKVNYEDAFGPVKLWDSIIYNHLSKKNIIVPPKVMKEKDTQYAGAYVKEPVPGMYDWVVSFDIASLYPNIIIGTNISPDTIVENPPFEIDNLSVENLLNKNTDTSILNKYNYAMAANGTFYSRSSMGFLAELMKDLFDQRKITKNKTLELKSILEKETDPEKIKEIKTNISVLDTKQMALKISLNSAYGGVGNPAFRYYDTRQAEAITLTGQLTIRWIQNRVNQYLNNLLKTENVDYVIASDTDSIFVNLSTLVNKLIKDTSNKTKVIDFLNKFCKEMMTPYIALCFDDLADYMNSASKRMDMKRDVIADRGVWTAKKRYCLNVYDSEGVRYKEPKLKIMGVEVQRSSTPKICRDSLKECIKIILTGTEEDLISHIEEVKEKFYKSTPEQIAFPRGVSDVKKYTDSIQLPAKGTPIAVKGAIRYNNALTKYGIENKYTKITNGDKVKFLHLKVPNTIGDKVLSFPASIPKEFGIDKYVDYDTQFEKAFLDPLDTILNAIGWKHEKTSNLDGFFE